MQIKICIEDSENAVFLTLEEAHQLVSQLTTALNRNVTFPVKLPFKANAEVDASTEESPGRSASPPYQKQYCKLCSLPTYCDKTTCIICREQIKLEDL